MIFSSNKTLFEIAKKAIDRGNINMYSQTYFLKPYSRKDLLRLLNLNNPGLKASQSNLDRALSLSGGHYQLFQLLLKSREANLLFDKSIAWQLKELYDYLTHNQKIQVRKIAFGKKITKPEKFLSDVGVIIKNKEYYRFFTPLFSEFIRAISPLKLPLKEKRLFELLMGKVGQAVSKEEIFEVVWKEKPCEASEWSLTSLIYRLKKHPWFIQKNYSIENRKKIGYTLIKE